MALSSTMKSPFPLHRAVRRARRGRGGIALSGELRRRFEDSRESGLLKHAQLRRAILAAITDGVLKPGDQIPSEKELTQYLAISLGTVQRALLQLVTEGVVVREHGRGTFIADEPRAFFRFMGEDGGILPVSSRVLDRRIVKESGPWSEALGDDPEGFVCISRLFNVDGRFQCHSEFFLAASRFHGMLDHPLGEDARLKRILGEEFQAPVLRVWQRVRAEKFPAKICRVINVDRGTFGLMVELVSFTFDDQAVCYQQNRFPATAYMLDMSVMDWTPRRSKGPRIMARRGEQP
jgi:GntR family transcriptional regulator